MKNQTVTLHTQTEASKLSKKSPEGVDVFNPDITSSIIRERPQGLKLLHEPQYSVSTRNLDGLRVKPPKWSDIIIQSMNQLSGRIFAFLQFSKRGKELWNYRVGVLGNSGRGGGAEKVKCWGGDLAKFNQAD